MCVNITQSKREEAAKKKKKLCDRVTLKEEQRERWAGGARANEEKFSPFNFLLFLVVVAPEGDTHKRRTFRFVFVCCAQSSAKSGAHKVDGGRFSVPSRPERSVSGSECVLSGLGCGLCAKWL